tara:strand:+ start:1207 stop:2394 length:1188 start_codon:yes stop_codon:yes gene_type:complete
MVHTNKVILLTIIALLCFYLYISKIYVNDKNMELFSLLQTLKDIFNKNKPKSIASSIQENTNDIIKKIDIKKIEQNYIKKYPNYVQKYNFILFKDMNKIKLNNNVISHHEYDKSTFNDAIITELDAMIVPLIYKINNKLNVSFNKDNIDYKKVIVKVDEKNNTLYQILLVLFQKKGDQKELKIELHKANNNKLNINDIKEVSSIHTLPLLQDNNDVNDYYNSNFGNDIHDPTHKENKEHFDSKINKNIQKISKFYNLQSQYTFPTIDEKLYDFDIPDKKVLAGYKDKVLDYENIDFKTNPNGVQQPSYSYNLWFIDREKEKNITKIFPKHKVSSSWDKTGTLYTKKNSEQDGIDYAYEQRNKIPRFHISQFAHSGNNMFNKLRAFTEFTNKYNVQ